MLRVGQKLWGINKETNKEDVVEVVEINKDYFVVKYKEKKGKYPYYTLGKKFFFEPQRKKGLVRTAFLDFQACVLQFPMRFVKTIEQSRKFRKKNGIIGLHMEMSLHIN